MHKSISSVSLTLHLAWNLSLITPHLLSAFSSHHAASFIVSSKSCIPFKHFFHFFLLPTKPHLSCSLSTFTILITTVLLPTHTSCTYKASSSQRVVGAMPSTLYCPTWAQRASQALAMLLLLGKPPPFPVSLHCLFSCSKCDSFRPQFCMCVGITTKLASDL